MTSRLFIEPGRAATRAAPARRPSCARRRAQVACGAIGALCVVVFGVAGGCAAVTPMPDLGRAEAAIRAAKEAQPDGDRTASIYLSVAEEDLSIAQRQCARGDAEAARRSVARAEIDAELAALVARDASVRRAVEETEREATALEDALQRVAEGSK